ncbi:MAG TPA: TIGR03089 family protein [Propionibacteriaceae bacterium]|nr:TIGR03089 family protein [Propionibacteriaceae bacterium]
MIAGMVIQISAALRRRAAVNGAQPLITFYDIGSGERTELSAISFRNWVDKTANLLVDEYALEAGDSVELPLATEAPGHWVTFVWAMACWQVGATADVRSAADPTAKLRVLGPDQTATLITADPLSADDVELVCCSLHPLGLGFPTPLPRPLVDYSLEVRSQPDSFPSIPVDHHAIAWRDNQQQLSQADLARIDAGAPRQRSLVIPSDPWSSVRDGLLTPLLRDGSAVVVAGEDPNRLDRIIASERVDPARG